MKRFILLFSVLFTAFIISSCNPLKWRPTMSTPLEDELKVSRNIVFTNTKETALRFTVADPKVIGQIASVIGRVEAVETKTDVMPDYTITFDLPNGNERTFSYWMGASENNKEINIMDEQGMYYRIAGSLDIYIINSTKMWMRPKNFTALYSESLSECIAKMEKDEYKDTVVAVDISSDRRMRRYTMSYEDEIMFNRISAQGYTVVPWSEKDKASYEVSFVTNMYNPDKARITVEAVKVASKTKQSFLVEAALENDNDWVIEVTEKE